MSHQGRRFHTTLITITTTTAGGLFPRVADAAPTLCIRPRGSALRGKYAGWNWIGTGQWVSSGARFFITRWFLGDY